jgi:hypothetical protein
LGFEFVNDELVPIRILHHCHVTTRRFKRVSGEWRACILELFDCLLEVFNLQRCTCPLIGRLPLLANIRDREGVFVERVFDPLSPIISSETASPSTCS